MTTAYNDALEENHVFSPDIFMPCIIPQLQVTVRDPVFLKEKEPNVLDSILILGTDRAGIVALDRDNANITTSLGPSQPNTHHSRWTVATSASSVFNTIESNISWSSKSVRSFISRVLDLTIAHGKLFLGQSRRFFADVS